MPEGVIYALAIIGSSAILATLIVGAVKLAFSAQVKRKDLSELKLKTESLEKLIEISKKFNETELGMLWNAVDDINKRLRDAEKET